MKSAALAMALWPSIASAQMAPSWSIYSANRTCAQWTEGKQKDDWSHKADQSWVLGLISGYNGVREYDVLSSSNLEGAFAWIDNRCAVNPLDPLSTVASQLIIELEARRRR
jgi:hypothetical protein